MQPLSPEHARFLLDTVYLPSLPNEHRITRAVIEAIPIDKGDYRPDEVSKSALDLAWHIVGTEIRFINAVEAGQFNLGPNPRPESIRNSQDLLNWYDQEFPAQIQKIQSLSDEQITKTIPFGAMFNLSAVMYLGFVLSHTIHHRGQLSVYLRPMGAKVPAMYGESYDSSAARKAAQQSA